MTPLRVESLIKPKHKLYKQKYQQNGCEGGAVLIETRDIADLDGFGLGGFYLDGVSAYYFLFSPFCMPLLQIDRVGSYSDKYTVVEIDAVALCLLAVWFCVVSVAVWTVLQAVKHRTLNRITVGIRDVNIDFLSFILGLF